MSNSIYRPYKHPVLFNMTFVLAGLFKKKITDIEQLIKKLGRKVDDTIDDRVTAIISTEFDVQRLVDEMKKADKHHIQVVSEEFLDEIQKPGADPISYIVSKSICDWWGGDVSFMESKLFNYM